MSAGFGQCSSGTGSCSTSVPHLIKFNGSLTDPQGLPVTGSVGVVFSIYRESSGGNPLWQETQNVSADPSGHYEAVLGVTKSDGVPTDVFAGGNSRWLGVQTILPGTMEQPRVLLVSVPYAMEAANAETLGGLPASAFVRAPVGILAPSSSTNNSSPVPSASGTAPGRASTTAPDLAVTTPGGTANALARFSTNTSIVNSQISDTNGVVTMQNLANTLFAEQFPGGVSDAIAACPASGCIINAVNPGADLNLGSIDPGTKAVTIYLGPYTYNVTQVTLRKGLKIIGMGASDNGTILQSVNGENPVFVIPQSNNSPAINVLLSGFRLLGSVNNKSEDAFFLDASTLFNAGLWYSTFDDIYISNFGGIGIHLRGPNTNFGAANQWIIFNNIVVYRPSGAGDGISIEGTNFELQFTNILVDGSVQGNGTNIYIGGLPGGTFSFPFVITFRGLVSQRAAVAVQLDGAQSVGFYTSHHERLSGAYQITNNTGIGTRGITIADSSFFSDVGVNNGQGFLLNVATAAAWGVRFVHNQIYGTPDSVVAGTNLAQVIYQDNTYNGSSAVPPTSGITAQIGPAGTINIGAAHSVGLNSSTTPITTIQSSLGAGETTTLFTVGGPVTFASGGNINLMGVSNLTLNGSLTLVRSDLSTLQWIPVAQWTPDQGSTSPGLAIWTPREPATVQAGASATIRLLLVTKGGFAGTTHLTCVGAPKESQCDISPDQIALNANSSTSATVVITTTAQNAAQARLGGGRPSGINAWRGTLPVGFLGLGITPLVILFRRKGCDANLRNYLKLVFLTFFCLLFVSCGSSGTSVAPELPPVSGTPPGTYGITVTASEGALTQSTTFFLIVQPTSSNPLRP